jgi:hypothetical protein
MTLYIWFALGRRRDLDGVRLGPSAISGHTAHAGYAGSTDLTDLRPEDPDTG